MNAQLIFSLMGLLVCGSLYSSVESPGHSKPAQAAGAKEEDQFSVLFVDKPEVHLWHYGKEVTRLQGVIDQALVIVKGNKDSQKAHQAAMEPQQQKMKKISDEMEPRKKAVADAEKSKSAFASTIVASRKSHLTDGLFATIAALTDIMALQESRIQALMKKNEELEGVLQSR